jgi:hypothetical protein
MNLDELKSARATAGANYAAAVTQLHDALVELAAIDQIFFNRTGESRTFGQIPDAVAFRHPEFAPDISGHWQSDVATRRNAILEGNV